MNERYEPAVIEPRWQALWEEEGAFHAADVPERPKSYVLEMFPYPSGRLHMGHVRNYSIGDVIARYRRLKGFEVLHPIGWDAFGLPAENAAIERGVHPAKWTYANIEAMRAQFRRLGFSFDWRREFATCDASYYRWEQLVFLKMIERGLAYRRHAPANWCPSCQTVLANEQVEDGLCWRCGATVESRALEQWFLRITSYAEELLAGSDRLAGWPERVLTMQRNWIGRSVGAEIRFVIAEPEIDTREITVFTTRADTLYGATFMSLAVEHPLVFRLARAAGREREVAAFVATVQAQSRAERAAGKEGVFLGAYCTNPVSGGKMPIYAANFVLMEYGTGAVMAVPAHDQRDFEFARRYDLPITVVIDPEDGRALSPETMPEAYDGPGRMVRSAEFDGLTSEEGKRAIAEHLSGRGIGGAKVQYRLRDWCISRQRYWGAPIPVVYCDACGMVPVPEGDLPVVLPLDVEFTGEGGSPLAKSESFVRVDCPRCGKAARRETDTMDTFVESSWYFARFTCPDDGGRVLDPVRANAWMPVDQYIGGIEHAVLHLIYARFYTMVLRDLGYVEASEPFERLLTQGMVCKETLECPEHGWLYPEDVEGGACRTCARPVTVGRMEKMSKSKRNVVDPDELIARYGADTVRLFCLFAAPPERDLEWSEQGVEGASRFLSRLWRLAHASREIVRSAEAVPPIGELSEKSLALHRQTQRTILRASEDLGERFHFNTAIAAVMELVNAVSRFADEAVPAGSAEAAVLREAFRSALLLLSPVVPHATAEIWEAFGFPCSLDREAWPVADESVFADESVTLVVQVNGRVRGRLSVPRGASEETVVAKAFADDNVQRHLDGRPLKKRIFVADRLLNLVVE